MTTGGWYTVTLLHWYTGAGASPVIKYGFDLTPGISAGDSHRRRPERCQAYNLTASHAETNIFSGRHKSEPCAITGEARRID